MPDLMSDMDGYSEEQAYRGRWRNPDYSSGAVEHAIGPVDFLTPMGIGATAGSAIGYGVGRFMGKAGGTVADLIFPTSRMLAGSGSPQAAKWGGRIGAGYGGILGVGGGIDAADDVRNDLWNRYLETQLPPRPSYPPGWPSY